MNHIPRVQGFRVSILNPDIPMLVFLLPPPPPPPPLAGAQGLERESQLEGELDNVRARVRELERLVDTTSARAMGGDKSKPVARLLTGLGYTDEVVRKCTDVAQKLAMLAHFADELQVRQRGRRASAPCCVCFERWVNTYGSTRDRETCGQRRIRMLAC